ncbi:MAG TPA: aldose epimerase family protein [Lacibacter sp.]|nr:aldose epimerase family protein [Lacibacter sp.]HMO88266.1 aldose epimerase family protein [Lacibacter sp.]HMP86666.1 aldose epimerase family protein [Lacibacter sp.]
MISFRNKIKWSRLAGQWQQAVDHAPLALYILESDVACVTITNFGLRMVHLLVAGSDGEPVDIVVGPETPEGFFQSSNPYYGAVIGRYANRIAAGRFTLNGQTCQLACNNGPNHLHGGVTGLHNQVWDCVQQTERELVFEHTSPDGAEGYPGNVSIRVAFQLSGNRLTMRYEATTDAPTLLNLTHHPFFNLSGCGSSNIEDQQLDLECDNYLPVRPDMIPEGTLRPVDGTPFDFRGGVSVTTQLQQEHQQLRRAGGFDHTFVRRGYPSDEPGLVAAAWSERTGIGLRILTTEPGVQLYTGNFMDGTNVVKNGAADLYRSAFCLETQHFPDSPNQPQFPPVVLNPGQTWQSTTVFEFFNQGTTNRL